LETEIEKKEIDLIEKEIELKNVYFINEKIIIEKNKALMELKDLKDKYNNLLKENKNLRIKCKNEKINFDEIFSKEKQINSFLNELEATPIVLEELKQKLKEMDLFIKKYHHLMQDFFFST